MRSPERSGGRLVVAVVFALGGCANDAPPATTGSEITAATSAPAATQPPVVADAPDITAAASPSAGSSPNASASVLPDVGGGVVAVSGGELPDVVVDAYIAGGGDLLEPGEWVGRFGTAGLPTVDGRGVRLVEATMRAEHSGDADVWDRIDEANWLVIDDRPSLDDLLDAAVASVGVAGWVSTATTSEVNGAACTQRNYTQPDQTTPAAGAVAWTVQGCSYPQFAKMASIGVSRSGVVAAATPIVDASMPGLLDEIDGTVDFVEVTFGAPTPDGATLHISVHAATAPGDVGEIAGRLLDGPLAGWQVLRGDDSALLTGPNGGVWTLSSGVATFDLAGRI